MSNEYKLGVNSVAYVNTASYGTPTWAELEEFGEFTLNLNWDMVDVPVRGQRVKGKRKTLANLACTGKRLTEAVTTGSTYERLLDAVFTDTALDVLVLTDDRLTPGTTGVRFWAQLNSGAQEQGPAAVLMDEIVFEATPPPSAAERAKRARVTGTAGAGVLEYTPVGEPWPA